MKTITPFDVKIVELEHMRPGMILTEGVVLEVDAEVGVVRTLHAVLSPADAADGDPAGYQVLGKVELGMINTIREMHGFSPVTRATGQPSKRRRHATV